MKNVIRLLATMMAVCAMICLTSTRALAQDENAQTEGTWVGEVVDLNCYIARGAKGPDHAGCAKGCVKGGQPMGLLTDDGTLVLLSKDNSNKEAFENLKEMAGEKASVKGKLNARDGMSMLIVLAAEKP
jgi:hypothetical protein